ncbi:MAG: GDP-mannose 4,6-dehydratase [Terriglobia bacterium]|jgi:UDP-glucose 4-epimerase|nr:GDP-mannose 4,6-dehydratase [Terriglobia bacterium]
MRVLITGGAGFIGSHLTETFLSLGHHVSCVDDLSTGSLDNLSSVREHPNLLLYEDTIFNTRLTSELVDEADVIFHLAAAVGVKRIVDFPVQTIETNVEGTEIVLDAAAKTGKRIFVASTSEVYGKSTKIPFSETDDLVLGSTYNSRWAYACSKAMDEFLAFAYFREHNLPVTIVRFFNTVGPRQTGRYGMVLPTFVRQALLNEPLTVYGTGAQSRCFGHVADIVNGLLLLLECDRAPGEIFNLGNTEEVTIEQLARKVIAACESNSEIVHISYSDAYGPGFEDMFRRVPDLSKAREWVGYQPRYSLNDIIRSVVDYERMVMAARQVA